jgi:hypothetical protein
MAFASNKLKIKDPVEDHFSEHSGFPETKACQQKYHTELVPFPGKWELADEKLNYLLQLISLELKLVAFSSLS